MKKNSVFVAVVFFLRIYVHFFVFFCFFFNFIKGLEWKVCAFVVN